MKSGEFMQRRKRLMEVMRIEETQSDFLNVRSKPSPSYLIVV